ncbi:8-amino-7-oxononanoate synthase [Paraburkholderia fungorum]|uniref:8-amino-7-oxononanoate synthase n=1 Tax=Paraburkholderia fungorum TaxID=134537 RepID=UPI0038BD643F
MMVSRQFPVTLMLAGKYNDNVGKYEVQDPASAGGSYVTISCRMGPKRTPFPTTGDPVLPFEPGETVEVELEISLHNGKEHSSAQAKELDSALNELVDFEKNDSLKTQILMQLAHANSVTLSYQMPIPQQPGETAAGAPPAAPSPADTQDDAQGGGQESKRVAVVDADPAAAGPNANLKQQLANRQRFPLMKTGASSQNNQPPLDPIGASSGPADGDYRTSKTINLQRTTRPLTGDVALWLLIKLNADMLSWTNYASQIDALFFPGGSAVDGAGATAQTQQLRSPMLDGTQQLSRRRFLPFTDTDAYRALKVATEAFVVTWGGVVPRGPDLPQIATLLTYDPEALRLANERLGLTITAEGPLSDQYFGKTGSPTLPYLRRVVQALQGTDAAASAEQAFADAAQTDGMGCGERCLWLEYWNNDISAKLAYPPLIELIWSYWMEEMQLVQTMNAISRRFQNVSSGPRDPLNQIELDALRPLNNLIWGWVQDEQHRLPIERRAAEYQHEYGFRLIGRAVPKIHAADNRSKFLAAFHTLLNLCVPFFRQADDTTVVPDGFPLLNALREVHLILSEGAHNQFRDMPTTSRVEMMMQQWLLARPEFREYLPRRAMIAYPEPWMHSVESMRKLQGWGDTNTYQFWQLATTGEQIVSSIRWSDWNSINDPVNAANWAAFFRPEIQTYIHSYRAVTGIDVGAEPVDVQVPGMHLLRRLNEQKGIKVA